MPSDLFSLAETRDSVWEFLPQMNRPVMRIYRFLVVAAAVAALVIFQWRIPVSVPIAGIMRPAHERTSVGSQVPGVIEKLFVREGDTVAANSLLFLLRDSAGPGDAMANEKEIRTDQDMLADLQRLTAFDSLGPEQVRQLKTPLYRQAALAYLSRAEGERLNWTGAHHEAELGRRLFGDKIISQKEYYDQRWKEDKAQAALSSVRRSQWALWQTELETRRQHLTECMNRQRQYRQRAVQQEIRAPAAGVVQGVRSLYPGSTVRPEQPLCTVSPEEELIGECYVSSREIGLLRPGQPMRIGVDAFNASYFGFLEGWISAISNDITLVDNKPVFVLRCRFSASGAPLRGGYRGLLRKGLGFQARCQVAERTLFQLMYDSVQDWFNPFDSATL